MGVPTVTRSGRTLVERQGESLMSCAGLADWVAQDEDQFIALALAKAGDIAALAALRARLRDQVLASPLFDAQRFARHLEAAFAEMVRARSQATTTT
jgi:predicted O-linked N-acetylglucosamine transferase (SPINDLY family)